MNDIRIGAKVLVDGEPCIVVGVDSITPGRRLAVTRAKFRNLKTGHVLESSIKRTDWRNSNLAPADGVLFFVAQGERIRVDTRTREYVARVK